MHLTHQMLSQMHCVLWRTIRTTRDRNFIYKKEGEKSPLISTDHKSKTNLTVTQTLMAFKTIPCEIKLTCKYRCLLTTQLAGCLVQSQSISHDDYSAHHDLLSLSHQPSFPSKLNKTQLARGVHFKQNCSTRIMPEYYIKLKEWKRVAI